MDYIGLLFLVIILGQFLMGYKKGFIVNLFETLKTVGLLVLAFLLCKVVGNLFLEGSIGESIINTLKEALMGINEDAFGMVVTAENKEFVLNDAWPLVPLPSSLKDGCYDLVVSYMDAEIGLTIGDYVSKALASYVATSIGFLAILIFGSIACTVLLIIFKKFSGRKGTLSRILGGVVGAVRGLITVSIICYVISIVYSLAPSSGIGEFIDSCLNSEVGIFRFFFDHNFLTYIVGLILKSL